MTRIEIELRGRDKPWSKILDTMAGTAEGAVLEAGINPLEVLIKLNGEFVPDTQKVKTGDRLELLEITSRG
jgi:sulfur carrier protein ThiS